MALLLGSEYNYFFGQYCFTIGDKKSAETFSGRTRMSFFGKKIKDSMKSQNESVDTNLDILLAESAEFLSDE